MQANSSSLHIWLVWDKNFKMKKEVFQKLLEKTGNDEDYKFKNKLSLAIFFNGKRYIEGMEI